MNKLNHCYSTPLLSVSGCWDLSIPTLAQSLNSLAILYCKQGKYEPSPSHWLAALHRYSHTVVGEPDHPDTAQSLSSLAVLYYEQGKYKQAEPLLRRAFAIRERQLLEPDHPDTAQSLTCLALLYCEQGKYKQAEPLLQRTIAIRGTATGT